MNRNFEKVILDIMELNRNYEVSITCWPDFDNKGFSINVTETGHDYCVEKARVDSKPSLMDAISAIWEQLTGEVGR